MKKKKAPQGKFGFEKDLHDSYDQHKWNVHKLVGTSKHKQVKPGVKHKIQFRKTP